MVRGRRLASALHYPAPRRLSLHLPLGETRPMPTADSGQ